MVIIRFADQESKRRALGYLAKHFSGKSWATGEVMVPEAALPSLAAEGFQFTVEGLATYDHVVTKYSCRCGSMTANRCRIAWSATRFSNWKRGLEPYHGRPS